MRLDKIHIRNYRGFEDFKVSLNPHFNLLIGDNGAGKTSFLDACAMLLDPFVSAIDNGLFNIQEGQRSFKLFNIPNKDIRRVIIDGQPVQQTATIQINGILDKKPILFNMENTSSDLLVFTTADDIKDTAKKMLRDSRKGDKILFPLLVYYGAGRFWKEHGTINYLKQREGVEEGYKDCITSHTNSDIFISWYKTYEDEIRKFDKKEDNVFLNVLNSTVSSFVKEWEGMAYSFRNDELTGFMTNQDGERQHLSFNQLSDGYRNMVAMVADMAFRCIQLNPHLGENVVKETEGVVLIDEIDLHLHPNWQREVVADFKQVFPKIQFITTSHSPFIVQSVKKEELINLSTNTKPEEDPNKQSIEDVAEDIMQVKGMPRSNEFNEMIKVAEEYYGLLKQGKNGTQVANLRKRLTQLEARYSDDAAFVALLKAERETKNLCTHSKFQRNDSSLF